MGNKTDYEVIIIGGSYAGLSAAMALGRALRKVLIIDSGAPCNQQTPHSHNFITQDGASPADISLLARVQVLRYPTITIMKGKAISGGKSESDFVIETENGESFSAKKLLFATGVRDIMPLINGFSECWGISILHCPYCHGYEAREQKTGIFANGEVAFHMAQMLSNWTDEIILFTNGKQELTKEQMTKTELHKIRLVETPLDRLEHASGALHTLVLKDGTKEKLSVLYAKIPMLQSCEIPAQLGCTFTESGLLVADECQRCTIPGIFAAGDATTHGRAISIAVASGTVAGITINGELISENW